MCEQCEAWQVWILRLEREGCLCGDVECILRHLEACLDSLSPCSLGSISACLRVLLGALSRPRICGSLAELCVLLKRVKGELFVVLYSEWIAQRDQDPYLGASLELILFPLLLCLPCAPSSCEALCRPFLHSLPDPSHALPLFLPLLQADEDEIQESDWPPCNASVPSTGQYDAHRSSALKYTGQLLCSNWRSLFASIYESEESSTREKLLFISVWNHCVRLHSSSCVPGFKGFVAHLNQILCVPSNASKRRRPLLWKKELEVLNTALCYGTTLGLQNEIPGDIFSLSQRLIALSKSPEYYASLNLPRTQPPGMGGSPPDSEGKVDTSLGSKLLLLHLKALAILVREAQACSSSEDSDASSISQSSDTLDIEKSILEIVSLMKEWMRTAFSFQGDASFLSMLLRIFRDQDDILIEGLLCLLDIYIGSKISSEDLSPLLAFQLFSESLDHSVLLDFLLSNETCFLLYFLRFLKYLNRGSRVHALFSPPCSGVLSILSHLKNAIDKLTEKGLFPYDISPVHKLLKQLIKGDASTIC